MSGCEGSEHRGAGLLGAAGSWGEHLQTSEPGARPGPRSAQLTVGLRGACASPHWPKTSSHKWEPEGPSCTAKRGAPRRSRDILRVSFDDAVSVLGRRRSQIHLACARFGIAAGLLHRLLNISARISLAGAQYLFWNPFKNEI